MDARLLPQITLVHTIGFSMTMCIYVKAQIFVGGLKTVWRSVGLPRHRHLFSRSSTAKHIDFGQLFHGPSERPYTSAVLHFGVRALWCTLVQLLHYILNCIHLKWRWLFGPFRYMLIQTVRFIVWIISIPDEELFSETAVGCTASYFVKYIWCSRCFFKPPPLFWGSVLLYLRSPKGGCCISNLCLVMHDRNLLLRWKFLLSKIWHF